MSQTAGSEYEEVVMTNYDPRVCASGQLGQLTLFQQAGIMDSGEGQYQLIHEPTKEQSAKEKSIGN